VRKGFGRSPRTLLPRRQPHWDSTVGPGCVRIHLMMAGLLDNGEGAQRGKQKASGCGSTRIVGVGLLLTFAVSGSADCDVAMFAREVCYPLAYLR